MKITRNDEGKWVKVSGRENEDWNIYSVENGQVTLCPDTDGPFLEVDESKIVKFCP